MSLEVSVISTERTTINRISLDDAQFFYELMNSPGWLRFIGDRSIGDLEAARSVIRDSYLKVYADFGFGYYVIKEAVKRKPIGICGFLKKPELTNPDFGFALLSAYQGKGLAIEACSAVLQFGIQAFGFSVLDAVTKSDNTSSIRLLEALGFLLQGPADSQQGLMLYRWTHD